LPVHLYSQSIHRDAKPCRKSFAAVDLLGFLVAIVFSDNFTIFVTQTSETALEALLVFRYPDFNAYRLNENFFIERLHLISPLQRLCMNQPGDTINIGGEVVDVLTLVDSPRNSIYRFVGIDISGIRSAPLKVFQQLQADVLILLPSLLSISVEGGEKTVERGLSENPFAFDFRETHVLRTPSPDRSGEIFKTLQLFAQTLG
jgi:hypothetical protein